MPPVKKFQREEIINTAYEIVKEKGLSSLNARSLAQKLGGSVQLIYHNFIDMNELVGEVREKIHKKYKENLEQATDENHPYLAKGMAYVKFAKDYPEFYKILFMEESKMNLEEFFQIDKDTNQNVMQSIIKKFDVSKEQLEDFHIKVWIFTHGLACLTATKTVRFSDEEIRKYLIETVNELFKGYKN